MNSENFNSLLRNLFTELINQGYKKFPITEVTLGKTFGPQFSKFLEDSDLGLTPLERMIRGLGFELHLIPVKSNDNEFHKQMDKKYQEFIDTSKSDLIDYLDNRPTKSGGGNKTKIDNDAFDDVLDDLFNEIEKED